MLVKFITGIYLLHKTFDIISLKDLKIPTRMIKMTYGKIDVSQIERTIMETDERVSMLRKLVKERISARHDSHSKKFLESDSPLNYDAVKEEFFLKILPKAQKLLNTYKSTNLSFWGTSISAEGVQSLATLHIMANYEYNA